MLLGGIIAVGADALDADDFDALLVLMAQLEHGQRIVQPRIRHRFQTDQHGLGRTVGRLVGGGETLEFDFDGHGSPLQMTLAATYAAGQLPQSIRPRAFDVLRKGLRWRGEIGASLITHLSGRHGSAAWSVAAYLDPTQWALDLLGLPTGRVRAEEGDPASVPPICSAMPIPITARTPRSRPSGSRS